MNDYNMKSFLGMDFFSIMIWLEATLSTTLSIKDIASKEGLGILSQIANSNTSKEENIRKISEIQKGILDAIDDILNIHQKDILQLQPSLSFIKSLIAILLK